MPNRVPLETFRPGAIPDLCYGLGRDYAVPLLTRRALVRCGEAAMLTRDTLPCRVNLAGPRRPPC